MATVPANTLTTQPCDYIKLSDPSKTISRFQNCRYVVIVQFALFIYFWLCKLFSPASRGCSLGAVCELLVVAASPVAEPGLEGVWASGVVAPTLWSTGSVHVVHGLSCSEAC